MAVLLAVDWIGLSTFIGVLAGAITSIIVALRQEGVVRDVRDVDVTVQRVHQEVKTINSLTLAQIAEAGESRRIDLIPEDDRSLVERDHLAMVPILGPEEHAPVIPETTATGVDQPSDPPVTDPLTRSDEEPA